MTWIPALAPSGLADGTTRTSLEDGDVVTITGWCGGNGADQRVGFGAATGTVDPAQVISS